MLDRLRYW